MVGALAMFAAACTSSAPARQAVPAAARAGARSPGPARSTQAATQSGTVTLAFAGDVHFTGRTARLLKHPATAFGPITPVLKSADFTAVNLETAVTSRGRPQPKTYHFRTTPVAFTALRDAGIDLATMANNQSFADVLSSAPRFVLFGTMALFIGDIVNNYVLAKMKIWTKGRWLWTRIVGSTLCGELVDSMIFYAVAFYGLMPWPHLLLIMFTQYGLKSGWEIVAAPLTYRVVAFLKRAEQEDYYDIDTNFTPFSLRA